MEKPQREVFQEALMSIVRGLGLHRPDATPCGFPVSLAEACAMVALQRAEPMPQRDLAQGLNLDKSTVSRLVADLEERGWIVREKAEHDARVTLLRRTATGADKSQAISAARNERLGGLLDHIPLAQRAQVVEAIQVLAEVVQNESLAPVA
jgi:DNA-binding MarR family transcriptional regulator